MVALTIAFLHRRPNGNLRSQVSQIFLIAGPTEKASAKREFKFATLTYIFYRDPSRSPSNLPRIQVSPVLGSVFDFQQTNISGISHRSPSKPLPGAQCWGKAKKGPFLAFVLLRFFLSLASFFRLFLTTMSLAEQAFQNPDHKQ